MVSPLLGGGLQMGAGLSLENLRLDLSAVEKEIVGFIRGCVEEAGATGVVIGLSGGVDSSTVAYLSVRALGSDRVFALILPSTTTAKQDIEDAKRIAESLGISYEVVEITPIEEAFAKACPRFDEANLIAVGNLKPRIRMMALYYYANLINRIVAGTSNKSELLVGYFTKYGDGGVDILPIGDLYKTQVRWLAEHLGVPKDIVWKTPTAGLWVGQTDEDELGIKYEELDVVLYGLIELSMKPEEVARKSGIPLSKVNRVVEMVRSSEHKRRTPPVVEVQKHRLSA